MCSQPFAAFVLRIAAMCLVPLLASAKLTGQEPSRTDRYGDPLPKGAIMRLGAARFAQPQPSNVVFSPDGKLLISAGSERRIRLWDPDTGKELRALEGHNDAVRWLSLSADGKLLASCSSDNDVILWEFDSGRVRRRFRSPIRTIQFLSLSPNGKILAISETSPLSADSTLRLWDTDAGKEIFALTSPRRHGPETVAFTPDSKQLAYSDRFDQDIHLIEATAGKTIRTFQGHKSRIHQLIFTPDGATLFSCSSDRTIRAWDVASGKEKQRFGDEKQTVGCFALAPDGKTLTYSTGSLMHIWDLAANKDGHPPHKAKAWIPPALAYSPDSKKVAVGGEAIAIYDTATGKRLNPVLDSESPIHQMKYALGGKLLLIWRWHDKAIELWDTARGRKTRTLRPKTDTYFTDMIVSPNGQHLITGEGDTFHGKRQSVICIWDLQTGARTKEFPQNDYLFGSLTYSEDGKTLRYQMADSHGQVFAFRDAATGKELRRMSASLRLPAPIQRQPEWKELLAPDGKVLVWRASADLVGLWDAETGNLRRSFGDRWMGFLIPPVISPDGRTIATFGNVGPERRVPFQLEILLYETASGKERLHIAANEGRRWPGTQIAFSPDGRLLASADWSEAFQVWDMATGKEVGRFIGHRGSINALSFAPDSKTLASAGADRTVLIWDVSGLAPAKKPEKEKLSREELTQCWDNLAGADVVRAYAAIAELVQHPDQAESLLKDKLADFKTADTQQLPRLIADLDSDDFKTRESASKELANLGRAAEGALRKTLDGQPSAEAKRRIKGLLEKLDRNAVDPRQIQLIRAVEVLERIGTPETQRLLAKLAKGAGDANVSHGAEAASQRLEKAGKSSP